VGRQPCPAAVRLRLLELLERVQPRLILLFIRQHQGLRSAADRCCGSVSLVCMLCIRSLPYVPSKQLSLTLL